MSLYWPKVTSGAVVTSKTAVNPSSLSSVTLTFGCVYGTNLCSRRAELYNSGNASLIA